MKTDHNHTYRDRTYHVGPYDPNWVRQFEAYGLNIRTILGDDLRIEHIGSTAVPGMSGKPCVDVLVIVKNLNFVKENIRRLEDMGFISAGAFVMENSLLFRQMDGNTVLANIHFFPNGHPHIEDMLTLRDYLRTHPNKAKAYAEFKEELYVRQKKDYAAYRKEKDAYMENMKKRAMRWRNGTRE
jgi:GrpB-like predicted nucleotidyltransferase (UPF0157 family)